MDYLFKARIDGWDSWGKVFRDIGIFRPLVERILCRERLSFAEIENCPPGTHAVFKTGDLIVKIYAPDESGIGRDECARELWGLKTACSLGVPAAQPVAYGTLEDRYRFDYLITRRLRAESFENVRSRMSSHEKARFGSAMRRLTDRMNVPANSPFPCALIETAKRNERWNVFPPPFQRELAAYWSGLRITGSVFVHGDLNPDNVFVDETGFPALIDFGDALTAPVVYEQAVVAGELFRFDPPFMRGYFGRLPGQMIADICLEGLLLHDFGANIIADRFGGASSFTGLSALRQALLNLL